MFYRTTHIKHCRKPCRCYWCDERIKAGDSKVYAGGADDEGFGFSSMHPECYEASVKWSDSNRSSEECIPDGGMLRGSTEERETAL